MVSSLAPASTASLKPKPKDAVQTLLVLHRSSGTAAHDEDDFEVAWTFHTRL